MITYIPRVLNKIKYHFSTNLAPLAQLEKGIAAAISSFTKTP
ncbi:hypothetical protein [Heyndrickxia oleronia]|nr:hypothetical protein [Heyndrickxia oleronia]